MPPRNQSRVEVPGEETSAAEEAGEIAGEGSQAQDEAAEAPAPQKRAAAVRKEPASPLPAVKAAELPDQDEIDPAKIPYGQTVTTKQGVVCSTQPDPTHAIRPR